MRCVRKVDKCTCFGKKTHFQLKHSRTAAATCVCVWLFNAWAGSTISVEYESTKGLIRSGYLRLLSVNIDINCGGSNSSTCYGADCNKPALLGRHRYIIAATAARHWSHAHDLAIACGEVTERQGCLGLNPHSEVPLQHTHTHTHTCQLSCSLALLNWLSLQ